MGRANVRELRQKVVELLLRAENMQPRIWVLGERASDFRPGEAIPTS